MISEYDAFNATGKAIVIGKSVTKAVHEFMWPCDENFTARLKSILAEVESETPLPRHITAECLGLLVRDLITFHKEQPRQQYQSLIKDIVSLFEKFTDNSLSLFNSGIPVYLNNIKEIWICCEPCLELLKSNHLFYNQLIRIISTDIEKITFHLKSKIYYEALVKSLENEPIIASPADTINFNLIEELTTRPVYIYFQKNGGIFGVAGKSHPNGTFSDGKIVLDVDIPKDWFSFLNRESLHSYIHEIKSKSKG
ncbi:hypothetical protein [Desulfolutivibrio sp.]|uniref:hypothetical protein n=1 Tax=Desulfolutivibrio sp. TaxID=2773296 RepID=UPI002F961226